jgi:hypothetical protein
MAVSVGAFGRRVCYSRGGHAGRRERLPGAGERPDENEYAAGAADEHREGERLGPAAGEAAERGAKALGAVGDLAGGHGRTLRRTDGTAAKLPTEPVDEHSRAPPVPCAAARRRNGSVTVTRHTRSVARTRAGEGDGRTRARLVWCLWAGALLLFLGTAVLDPVPPEGYAVLYLLSAAVITTVAAVLAVRVPRNKIGWILLGLMVWSGAAAFAGAGLEASGRPAAVTLGTWLRHWTWVPLVLVPLTLVLLLFPDGRLPSPSWRPVLWASAVGIVGFAFEMATGPHLGGAPEYGPNPYHLQGGARVGGLLGVLVVPGLAGSLASVVVRFRRARGVERQQIKWLAYSGVLAVGMLLVVSLAGFFLDSSRFEPFLDLANALILLAVTLIPVAIGVAVLRYRLYDIDRLVSRTATYALLTGVLAGVYALGVLTASRMLAPLGASNDLSVAAATLLAAAAFSPARRRIQAAVDRRFDRARYDAGRFVAAFAEQLRDDVDLDGVLAATRRAVARSVAPRHLSLWLRDAEAGR